MQYHFAPVQGHTDAAYRHFHAKNYGGNLFYYTPFIRLEKDSIRNKDIKDLTSELNENHTLIPQIIFKDEKELNKLIQEIKALGFNRIDLNMGCPFPLQTGHGRGAATITNEDLGKAVKDAVNDHQDISFSVKMRLGLNDVTEWEKLLPYLNDTKLHHLAVHPRIARQQYGGEVDMGQFARILSESKNPVVYNGDLKITTDIKEIQDKYPTITGIMSGRGSLGRPSLMIEAEENNELSKEERLAKMLKFHDQLFSYYSSILCGEAQILSKIQPFWEYAEEEIGRKAWKLIKKASKLSKYQTALVAIKNQL